MLLNPEGQARLAGSAALFEQGSNLAAKAP
jgi:hypothetical protein